MMSSSVHSSTQFLADAAGCQDNLNNDGKNFPRANLPMLKIF